MSGSGETAFRDDFDDLLEAGLAAVAKLDDPQPAPGGLDEIVAGLEAAGRYQVEGELGRGGMGVVLAARDGKLGRAVAIKVLRDDLGFSAAAGRQVVEEARIASRLQHPGIVPIFDVGVVGGRRVYFTMRRVEGRTLEDALEGSDLLVLVRALRRVAEATSFAHARGVIHRDLKPSNVMLGDFGEVLVMDWGLAKVVGPRPFAAADEAGEMLDPGMTDAAADRSVAGTVKGTPSYMAPEQARGEVDRLDARTDVFALGAMLCEILTGEGPYRARDYSELRRMAARGDLSDARRRLADAGAPAELTALALRCMAFEPDERPADAGEVSAALAAFQDALEQRLKHAELTADKERARARHERRIRRLATVTATLVLLVLAVGTAAFLAERERRSLSRERRAAAAAAADARMVERLDGIRMARAGDSSFDTEDVDFLTALTDYGLVTRSDPLTFSAERLRRSRISGRLIEFLHEWILARRLSTAVGGGWTPIVDFVCAVDPDPRRRSLLAEVFTKWPADVDLGPDRLEGLPAATLDLLGTLVGRRRGPEPAVALYRQARAAHPGDFWLNVNLAYWLSKLPSPRLEEAARFATAACALNPAAPRAQVNLAVVLLRLGRLDEAYAAIERAVALDDSDWRVHLQRGSVLEARGDIDAAVASERRAHELAPAEPEPARVAGHMLADAGRPEEALSWFEKANAAAPGSAHVLCAMGAMQFKLGRVPEAETSFRAALEADPNHARTLFNLGALLARRKELAEAVALYERSIEQNPDYVEVHFNLGRALHALGRVDDALAALRRAVQLRPDHIAALANLGYFLRCDDEPEEGLRHLLRARELARRPELKSWLDGEIRLCRHEIAGTD